MSILLLKAVHLYGSTVLIVLYSVLYLNQDQDEAVTISVTM